MASLRKCNEITGWLSRTFRMDFKNSDLNEDWGRAFDKCTDKQMNEGKRRMETEYNSSFPPSPAMFLGFAGGLRKKISSGLTFNPMYQWTNPVTGTDHAFKTEQQMADYKMQVSAATTLREESAIHRSIRQ